jgi:hypothetical protein
LVVVVSVLVRLAVEGTMLPSIVPHAAWAYSIGLVVVPLTANAFWKTGLARGVVQNGVPTLIVYALLRFVLVPHTNLSLAGFHLSIENVGGSFLASPRAYVLLLTGAVLGAIANVRFGWDYGGILVPALMALVLTAPVKLAATLIEALGLVYFVRLLLRSTRVGRWNIEGPRRPVLFFTVDYAFRYSFAALVGRSLPGADVAGLTGLGYLLPTLLAVKVSQKGIAPLVLMPTLTVAAGAFGVSTAFAAVAHRLSTAESEPVVRTVGRAPDDPVLASLWLAGLARVEAAQGDPAPVSTEILVRTANALGRGEKTPLLPYVDAQPLTNGVIVVRERFQDLECRAGTPSVLIAPGPTPSIRVVAIVSAPLGAPQAALLAGHWLSERLADAVVVAGLEDLNRLATATLPAPYALARELAHADGRSGVVIDVRGATSESLAVRLTAQAGRIERVPGLMRDLERAIPHLSPSTEGPFSTGQDIEVDVPASAARAWFGEESTAPSLSTGTALAMAFDDALPIVADPSMEDLLVLRRLVLAPLLDVKGIRADSFPLRRAAARAVGYELAGPARLPDGDDALLLRPRSGGAGVAVLARVHGTHGLVIEAPHAGREPLRALALRLTDPLRADAVLLGFAPGEGALGNNAFAEAHAAATWPAPDRAASVVVVRESSVPEETLPARIGEWGGEPARVLSERVRIGLAGLGIAASPGPMDLASREQAGRSVFGNTPFVAVAVPQGLFHDTRFSPHDGTLDAFSTLPVRDDDPGTVALDLAATLAPGSPDAPDALFAAARGAVAEESVVAQRTFERLLTPGGAKAAVVRANDAVFLVVVARQRRFMTMGAFPMAFIAPDDSPPHTSSNLRDCAATLKHGGTCRAEMRP